MALLLYVLALTLTLIVSPAWAQMPQDEDATMLALLESGLRGNSVSMMALMIGAAQGNASAQFTVGVLNHERVEEGPQYTEAIRWYRLAADQGHAKAQYTLGLLCYNGHGVPQNYPKAVQWLRYAADQGLPKAQLLLGFMYANGKGVPQDYAQEVIWYRRAADQGLADAQLFLGGMYAEGHHMPQDYAQALKWYRRAADQGIASAQNNLGVMYARGQGVPQDYAQAYFWYNLSAARSSSDIFRETAMRNRDLLAARLTPAQLADTQARARTWQPTPETPSARPPTAQLPQLFANPPSVSASSQRGELIRKVQERLQAVGFSPGNIDGGLGPQTRNALRWYQNSKGLLATGEPDVQTLDALGMR